MIQVDAPTRLHFGLLHVPAETTDSPPLRRYGGLGLMLAAPRVTVQVSPAAEWSGEGPSAARASSFAQATVGPDTARFHVKVVACPPEHVGLGVGTQLGLATAAAVRSALGKTMDDPAELAASVGRGKRSAIGVYGFRHGGLIIDAGKFPGAALGTLAGRFDFPLDWPVVLMRPKLDALWYGRREQLAFNRPRIIEWATIDDMGRRMLLGIMPAIVERNYAAFAEHLFEYNRAAGLPFREDQGGVYAGPELERIIETARKSGTPAVGQSSWGPTAFAICESTAAAAELIERIESEFPECETTLTCADNRGAVLQDDSKQGDGNDIRRQHE